MFITSVSFRTKLSMSNKAIWLCLLYNLVRLHIGDNVKSTTPRRAARLYKSYELHNTQGLKTF